MILRCQVGHSWVKHTQTVINNAQLLLCRVQTTFRMYTYHPSRESHWAPMLIFLNACQKSPKILLHHLQPQRDTMTISQELWERSVVLRANWRGCRISAGEHTAKGNLTKKEGRWRSNMVKLPMSRAFFTFFGEDNHTCIYRTCQLLKLPNQLHVFEPLNNMHEYLQSCDISIAHIIIVPCTWNSTFNTLQRLFGLF